MPGPDTGRLRRFLYQVANEHSKALGLLRRRAEGEYGPDKRLAPVVVPLFQICEARLYGPLVALCSPPSLP